MKKYYEGLTDDSLWEIFDRTGSEAARNELEKRGWDTEADIFTPSPEDYREWAAASCGMDYVPYYM